MVFFRSSEYCIKIVNDCMHPEVIIQKLTSLDPLIMYARDELSSDKATLSKLRGHRDRLSATLKRQTGISRSLWIVRLLYKAPCSAVWLSSMRTLSAQKFFVYYLCGQRKGDEIGGERSTHGRNEKFIQKYYLKIT